MLRITEPVTPLQRGRLAKHLRLTSAAATSYSLVIMSLIFRLSDLESLADSIIVDRAFDYLAQDRVRSLHENGRGEYVAIVDGSGTYDVQVSLDKEAGTAEDPMVTNVACTCPYDITPVCKHVAAVLLVVRERLDQAENGVGKDDTPQVAPELETLISGLSREELEEIVRRQAGSDRRFALMIQSEYSPEPTDRTAAELRGTIRAELERFRGAWGLIPYSESFAAAGTLDRYFDHVDADIEHGAYRSAFRVLTAVMEEAAAATQYTDDSGGAFGDAMYRSVRTMKSIAESDIDAGLRDEMMSYVKRISATDSFVDPGDLRFGLWELAAEVVRSEEEYRELCAMLSEALPPEESTYSSFYHNFEREGLLVLLVRLMERFGDAKKAQGIRAENKHLPQFRRQLLEQAQRDGDYAEVARIAEKGVSADASLPGLVAEWRTWALGAYRTVGDDDEARRIAHDLVIAGDAEYLGAFKSLVPADQWSAQREELIRELQASSGRGQRIVPEVLAYEKLWDRLMQFVECNEYSVTEYGDRLLAHFPDRVRTVWEQLLLTEARSTSQRSAYRRLAGSILDYADVAGRHAALGLRDRILEEFPNRPAMRDELSRV